ncbi:MAG TPA: ModE family transcriptional regulator [Persephonella sp.]|uniref:Molybdenum-pterin-binding protein n=1 Tax=Persephonella marina (strain DSM 14350 / EX-H1) TaxID=123214 RepID=C0QSP7_PERMH|nr:MULTISPECIES: winged helix-turn-helix domain-containing protein [Persephonella]ACO04613.1 molybdenum-pterin-binding protein [Persephonella marina EX-H1]HCB69440.1 ModE family transcriptional regulator [Persephonella sp.]
MRYQIKYKVWLEKDGEIIMGLGREKLLKEIQKQGSISKAAKELGISYKKAWSFLKAMEKRLGTKLVETKRGGEKGGGAVLTEEAQKLIKEFEKLVKRFEGVKKRAESNG